MALDARRHQRLLMVVLSQSAWTLAVGLTIGVAGALSVTRLMRGLLFGIGPADPPTLSLMAAILPVVALIASYVPARRAAEVDPMVALRNE
jgi:putative ABC transport system permease protein